MIKGSLPAAADCLADRRDELVSIIVINAAGVILVQTIWVDDRRRSRRRTDIERVADLSALERRLGELVPALCLVTDQPATPSTASRASSAA